MTLLDTRWISHFRRNREGTVFTGVCLSTSGGGSTPSPFHSTSIGPMSLARGYPIQSWMEVPCLGLDGVSPHQEWMVVTPSRLDGVPPVGLDGVPLAIGTG